MVAGRRHHNCITTIAMFTDGNYKKELTAREAQGFITSKDRFVSRKEAYEIAKEAGQLLYGIHDKTNPILVSEDLY